MELMFRKWIFFIITFLLILVTISIITFNPYDSNSITDQGNTQVENYLGLPGSYISTILFTLFGRWTYFFILFFVLLYFSLFFNILSNNRVNKFIGLFLFVFAIAYFNVILTNDVSFRAGGILAGALHHFIKVIGGIVGEWLLLIILVLLSISLIFGIDKKNMLCYLEKTIQFFKRSSIGLGNKANLANKPPLIQKVTSHNVEHEKHTDNGVTIKHTSYKKDYDESCDIEGDGLCVLEIDKDIEDSKKDLIDNNVNIMLSEGYTKSDGFYGEKVDYDISEYEVITDPLKSINKHYIEHSKSNSIDKSILSLESDNLETVDKPIIANTDDQANNSIHCSSDLEYDENNTSLKLERTLNEFGVDARVDKVTRGPVITRYEIIIPAGIKVSKIVGLQDNLALSLASSKIRIIAPIPGKSAVGVEVPNKHRKVVTLDELVNTDEYRSQPYSLPIILGKGISGIPLIFDLSSMPHLLIAGSTGSGKSVFVNVLISSILLSKTANEVRFLMIDPKRVELKLYDEIPHLIAPVITEAKKAVVALKWAVNNMEERYILLEKYNSRDIKSYNKKLAELKKKQPNYVLDPPLEYLTIIVDEFADLMMVCGKEVEGYVSRLAAMARAVGIHLVLATQRPSVDVITGLIKANFPARIAFQVSSKTESRIILDCNGAEKLLGKGDFLFSAPGIGDNKRIQGVLLKDDEVYDITSRLKSQEKPNYIPELLAIEDTESINTFTIADEPLFREAVEIILADRKVSASYLQRRMRIGYNRAARIIELLEEEGIVSSSKGSRPRDILIESYEF